MTTTDSLIKFLEVCNLLENISNANNVDDKRKFLKEFITYYRNKPNTTNKSFYPVLRLLLPKEERERKAYHLKEFAFTKTIINILALDNNGQDANLLKNYKTCKNAAIRSYPDAAYAVLKKHFANKSTLSVYDVNKYLDEIALYASNDIRAQESSVLNLFKATAPLEQKWIIRIILKNVKLRFSCQNILNELHKDAALLFSNNKNLAKTCELLINPNVKIDFKISVFNAFQPMLSMRCDDQEFRKAVTGSQTFYLENKFDGERFQIHFQGGEFKYFSRQGYDFTETYGKDYQSTGFTNRLQAAINTNVTSFILDGEMMIWDIRTKKFGYKGMDVDVKKLKSNHDRYRACFCVFDILLLNDEELTQKALSERKKLLSEVVTSIEGVIMLSSYSEVTSMKEIISALNTSMDKLEEGIVFKNTDSTYVPNSRRGWWKMKLEYFKNVMSDLDVVIIGGYYGKSKAIVRDFLAGVIDKSTTDRKYLSFAKVTTGLSYDERKELHEKLNVHWLPVNGNEHERYGVFWGKEKPDVWIKPEESTCLLVRGTELTQTHGPNPAYKAKYTLRFPRILSIRFDKPYYDCLTTTELDSLTQSSGLVVKLSKRHLELSDIEVSTKKRKRNFITELVPVDDVSDILEGHEFLVLSGKNEWTKERVELAIRENGGTVVQAENEATFCMLVGDSHLRVPGYKGSVDIVDVEWLRNILNDGEFNMYTPNDMIYTTPKRKEYFKRFYDKFADSYLDFATVESIKYIARNVFTEEFEKDNYINLMPSEVREINAEMKFCDKNKIYRGFKVYFDKYKIINDNYSKELSWYSFLEEIDFIHKGGIVCNTLSKDCLFVITNTSDNDRVFELESYLSSIHYDNKVKIINCTADILTNTWN